MWLSQMKGSWPTPALALGLVFLDQLGLDRSGTCWLMYHGSHVLLTNRCLETPQDYIPSVAPECFCDHEVIVTAL
jgi:hypothetical protein